MTLVILPSKMVFTQGNSQDMSVQLVDKLAGTPINNASLSGTLVDCNGNEINGCIDVLLTSIDFIGNYVGTFGDNTFFPPVSTGYTLIVEGTYPPDGFVRYEFIVEIIAQR